MDTCKNSQNTFSRETLRKWDLGPVLDLLRRIRVCGSLFEKCPMLEPRSLLGYPNFLVDWKTTKSLRGLVKGATSYVLSVSRRFRDYEAATILTKLPSFPTSREARLRSRKKLLGTFLLLLSNERVKNKKGSRGGYDFYFSYDSKSKKLEEWRDARDENSIVDYTKYYDGWTLIRNALRL